MGNSTKVQKCVFFSRFFAKKSFGQMTKNCVIFFFFDFFFFFFDFYRIPIGCDPENRGGNFSGGSREPRAQRCVENGKKGTDPGRIPPKIPPGSPQNDPKMTPYRHPYKPPIKLMLESKICPKILSIKGGKMRGFWGDFGGISGDVPGLSREDPSDKKISRNFPKCPKTGRFRPFLHRFFGHISVLNISFKGVCFR